MKIKIREKKQLIHRIMEDKDISLSEAQQVYSDMSIKDRKRQIGEMRK